MLPGGGAFSSLNLIFCAKIKYSFSFAKKELYNPIHFITKIEIQFDKNVLKILSHFSDFWTNFRRFFFFSNPSQQIDLVPASSTSSDVWKLTSFCLVLIMTTEWQKVLESKLDQMLSSSQTLKSSIKSLQSDFQRLDSYINLLQVQNTNQDNLADDDEQVTTFMPYFEEFFQEEDDQYYYEFPDFYCLRFRRKSQISSFMPHVFIV